MVRLIYAALVATLLGWQGSAVAVVGPQSSPSTVVDAEQDLTALGMGGPVLATTRDDASAQRDRTLAEHLLPVRQAEIDNFLDLAARLESGRGVVADPRQAFTFYQAAALRGDGFAQEQVARFYETGHGMERDIDQALRWYHLAAEQGYPAAQLALVRILSTGEGVTPRPEQAYLWALVVMGNPAVPREALRHVNALQHLLEQQLQPDQRDAARHRARELKTAGRDYSHH